jgi:hypothetical protein
MLPVQRLVVAILMCVNYVTSSETGSCSRSLVAMPSVCGQKCLLLKYGVSCMHCDYCFWFCWCMSGVSNVWHACELRALLAVGL